MKEKSAIAMFILCFIFMFALTGCGDPEIPFVPPTHRLDRKALINAIPVEEQNPGTLTTPRIVVLLDDSSSIARYISDGRNTAYEQAIIACGGFFKNTGDGHFAGYSTSALLSDASTPIANDDVSDYFVKAATAGQYRSDDISRVGTAFRNLKEVESYRRNQVILLITDMLITDSNRRYSEWELLSEEMMMYVKSKSANIGIVAIRSFCRGNLPTVPEVTLQPPHTFTGFLQGFPTAALDGEINGGNGADRNIYFIFMGDSELVEKYTKELAQSDELEVFSSNGKVEILLLDEYPQSEVSLPVAVPLSEKPGNILLSDSFSAYAKELPGTNPFSFVLNEPLIDGWGYKHDELMWDDRISEGNIPFWRVWNEQAERGTAKITATFDVGDEIITGDGNISIRCLTLDHTGSTVVYSDNNQNYFPLKSCDISNGKMTVSLTLSLSKLNLNEPIVFMLDVPLMKKIAIPSYSPIEYEENENVRWVDKWSMNWDEYFRAAYRLFPAQTDDQGNVIRAAYWAIGVGARGYVNITTSVVGTTPFLDEFIRSLYVARQDFISESNKSDVNDDVHQYAWFGFVKRQSLMADKTMANAEAVKEGQKVNVKADPEDNGGYAFSTIEIAQMRRDIENSSAITAGDG